MIEFFGKENLKTTKFSMIPNHKFIYFIIFDQRFLLQF